MAVFEMMYATDEDKAMVLVEEGGRMQRFEVAPGIQLSFNELATDSCYRALEVTQEFLELDYCMSGCYEVVLDDGSVIFLGEGDLAVSNLGPGRRLFSGSRLPTGRYRGITVLVALAKAQQELNADFPQGDIDLAALRERLCGDGQVMIVQEKQRLAHILGELADAGEERRAPYFWLKVMELLLFLSLVDGAGVKRPQHFSVETSQRTRAVYECLMQEPFTTLTIPELAVRFGIGESSLKRCFKSLTGVSLGAFMKRKRIEAAAALLVAEPLLAVGEVGARAGYENQSKFSAAFKAVMGTTPHAYRRSRCSEWSKNWPLRS